MLEMKLPLFRLMGPVMGFARPLWRTIMAGGGEKVTVVSLSDPVALPLD